MKNKRADIIQAAYELFLENGYDNTSIKMISQRADVAQGHLYNFFQGKEDLFDAVLRMAQDSYQSRMFAAVQEYAHLPAEEFAESFIDAMFELRADACLVLSSASIPKLQHLAEPVLKEYSDSMIEMMHPLFPGLSDDLLYNIGSILLAVSDSMLVDGDKERGIRTGVFAMKLIQSYLDDSKP